MNQFMKKDGEAVFLRCFLTKRVECGDGIDFGGLN